MKNLLYMPGGMGQEIFWKKAEGLHISRINAIISEMIMKKESSEVWS